jgi:hypothetical protein
MKQQQHMHSSSSSSSSRGGSKHTVGDILSRLRKACVLPLLEQQQQLAKRRIRVHMSPALT